MFDIGVDIGGTIIKIGLFNQDMELLQRSEIEFPKSNGYENVMALITDKIHGMLKIQNIKTDVLDSIGICVAGTIDKPNLTVIDAYSLDFHDAPIGIKIQENFPGIPVYIENDANAATIAEYELGALRGSRTAILLTLGTGVGGGIIIDGKLYNGGMGHGVEIGHYVLKHDGMQCSCGLKGCMETMCSATALARIGREAFDLNPDGALRTASGGDRNKIDAKLIFDCAKLGDPVSAAIVEGYIDILSSGVASYINVLDPEVLAIGGGVSFAGRQLIEPLKLNVAPKVFFKEFGQIVLAQLGNDAGITGAALLKRL